MKKIEIEVFSFSELSEKAKEYARDKFREHHDDPMMQSHMINLLKEKIEERGINLLKEKIEERGIKYDVDSIDVRYSLSHCQGDGFMFEGIFEWKADNGTDTRVCIKHRDNHYYHKRTASIEWWHDEEGNDHDWNDADKEKFFLEFYYPLCDEMERVGYDEIEYQNSAEYIDEILEANEYDYLKDGSIFTA